MSKRMGGAWGESAWGAVEWPEASGWDNPPDWALEAEALAALASLPQTPPTGAAEEANVLAALSESEAMAAIERGQRVVSAAMAEGRGGEVRAATLAQLDRISAPLSSLPLAERGAFWNALSSALEGAGRGDCAPSNAPQAMRPKRPKTRLLAV